MNELQCPKCGVVFDDCTGIRRDVRKVETFFYNKERNCLELRYSDDYDYKYLRCENCGCDVSEVFEGIDIDYTM